MDENLRQAVKVIHSSPTKVVLYVSGGASHAPSWLLSVPGASSTILECRIPYERAAFVEVVGANVAASMVSFASTTAARALATAAYQRAVRLTSPGVRVCGVAAACALASSDPRKGTHRAFVATQTNDRLTEYELLLSKGSRSRWEEEVMSSRLVLQALLDDCGGVSTRNAKDATTSAELHSDALVLSHESSMSVMRDLLGSADKIKGPVVHEHNDPIASVQGGQIRFAEYSHGMVTRDACSASLIFSGSFNPVHYGHRQLMSVAQSMYPNDRAAYEISITNVDKPPLDPHVVRARLEQFGEDDAVLITSAPLFSAKAEMLPGAKFIIGVDTALRLVDPKYYGGQSGMISSLIDLKAKRCKFLVAGRLQQSSDGPKRFQTLGDVRIPTGFEDMFQSIPDTDFRADVSSSEIRAKQKS